jgi:ribosome biogenesis SPOUT family RNA methylase Rps3
MTTDTAVRVTRIVVQDKVPLEKIPYIDHPELRLDEHESTEMPFRYVKDKEEKPVMPEVSCSLILSMSKVVWESISADLICVSGNGGVDLEGFGERFWGHAMR